MVILHKRNASSVSRRSDQPDCHFVRNVECFDQNRFIALESNGIFHKKFGEIVESGVVHKTVTIPPSVADATQLIGQLELAHANEACRKSTGVMVSEGSRRSEEHTSELQSPYDLVCRLLLEKKKL